jgi:acyl-coenzyme A thioesterase PaaI-like protein
VKFKKPVKTRTHIKASGEVVEEKGRVIGTRGWVFDDGGAIMAEADAKFIIVDGEKPVDSTAKEP